MSVNRITGKITKAIMGKKGVTIEIKAHWDQVPDDIGMWLQKHVSVEEMAGNTSGVGETPIERAAREAESNRNCPDRD